MDATRKDLSQDQRISSLETEIGTLRQRLHDAHERIDTLQKDFGEAIRVQVALNKELEEFRAELAKLEPLLPLAQFADRIHHLVEHLPPVH